MIVVTTLTYYENDIVKVRHGISNDMGTDYETI